MRLTVSALAAALASTVSHAFILPTSPMGTSRRTVLSPISLRMATPGGRQNKGTGKGTPKKKRRFLQDLGYDGGGTSTGPPSGIRRVAGRPGPAGDGADGRSAARPKPKPKRAGGARNGGEGSDPSLSMMQSAKSIEELESIMEKRWGTSMERWTADPGEYEFASDDDDDGGGDSIHADSVSRGQSPKFRAKPVLDPWQREEVKKRANYERDAAEVKKSKNVAKVLKDADRQDVVLDRVRRNQEKMRARREAIEGRTEGLPAKKNQQRQTNEKEVVIKESDLILDEDDVPEMQIEFYDEDDEGYEAYGSTWSTDEGEDNDLNIAYDAIISPKPVGGSGRSVEHRTKAESNAGGFFFRQIEPVESDIDADAMSGVEEVPKRKKRAKEFRRPAVLDANGKEMLLTLEQAEKNVKRYLASISTAEGEKNEKEDSLSASSWEDIGITDAGLLDNLRHKMRCPTPLSVQDQSCPPVLSGNDVLVSTHTGSGKTLAFLAPLAQRLLFDLSGTSGASDSGVKVIVVAPGRELASQIVSVARELFEGTALTAVLAIGGTPFTRNVDMIRKRKPDIVVGTPGRIAELVVGRPGEKSGRLKITSLQTIVLDEFDALLEYEAHKEPTGAIVRAVKRRHGDSLQSILCSATAADMIGGEKLGKFLKPGYAHAMVDEGDKLVTSGSNDEADESTMTRVSRTAIHGTVNVPHKKLALETLRRILHTEPLPQQVLVFVDNARRVGIVVDKLAEMGIVAAPLHGGAGSGKEDRAEVSKALREGYVGIVVATELAARGIDAPYLTHVVNLDLPTDASHYAHRAGRCGRGGRPGVIINITSGPSEKGVPRRFADSLGIHMHVVEARAGKLFLVKDD